MDSKKSKYIHTFASRGQQTMIMMMMMIMIVACHRATTVHQQVSHFYRRRASAAVPSAPSESHTGLVSLRALTLIATIIQELVVGGSHASWANKVAVTAGFVQASLPAIIRVCQSGNVFGSSSYDGAEVALVILCFLTTWFFLFVGVSFITTGVVDYLRRAHLLEGTTIAPHCLC